MNLYLKDGESVLRSWDYAKRKGKTKGKLNLTVTNNRIISTSYHRNRIERKEFEVSAVKSVDAFTGIRKAGFWRTFLAIILFVYSLALLFPVIMYLNGINLLGEIGKNLAINYFCLFLLFIIFGILLLRRRNLFALRIILKANLIPTVIKKSNRLTGAFYLIPLLINTFLTLSIFLIALKISKYSL